MQSGMLTGQGYSTSQPRIQGIKINTHIQIIYDAYISVNLGCVCHYMSFFFTHVLIKTHHAPQKPQVKVSKWQKCKELVMTHQAAGRKDFARLSSCIFVLHPYPTRLCIASSSYIRAAKLYLSFSVFSYPKISILLRKSVFFRAAITWQKKIHFYLTCQRQI